MNWRVVKTSAYLEIGDMTVCHVYLCPSDGLYYIHYSIAIDEDPIECLGTPKLEDAKCIALSYVIKYCSNYIQTFTEIISACSTYSE